MRQTQRLVLEHVGDVHAEARAVAGGRFDLGARLGRDHDPDLLDARRGHRLDAVKQHGLVGHGHQLLGARVRDRTQARAPATGQDQSLQLLHRRRVSLLARASPPPCLTVVGRAHRVSGPVGRGGPGRERPGPPQT